MKRKAYLSQLAAKPLTDYLETNGFKPVLLTGSAADGRPSPVHGAISAHADIYMCRLGLWENATLFKGDQDRLGRSYPEDIPYNAVCTGQLFIHNLKHTDPALTDAAEKWHAAFFPGRKLRFISVPQGYTRCCCLPVDDTSFITSDKGIANALASADAEVLLIEKGHVALPGFDYGFIGGCAGHLSIPAVPDCCDCYNDSGKTRRIIVFNGDLSAHPDFEKIISFIEERDIEPVWFRGFPLTDIGCILTE